MSSTFDLQLEQYQTFHAFNPHLEKQVGQDGGLKKVTWVILSLIPT
jgi:hypothetical protein